MRDTLAVQLMTLGLVAVAGLSASPNVPHALRFLQTVKTLAIDRRLPATPLCDRPRGGLRVV